MEAFPVVWVDREDEARRVLDFVVSARSRLVILYGKHGIGKTSLIRRWVMPAARSLDRYEVYYGKCDPKLPERVGSPDGEQELWAAAARPALIFIDSFERLLDLPDSPREEILVDLCARVESPEHASILVLILDEDRLGRAFALRTHLPEVAHAALEIRGIDTDDSVAALHSMAHEGACDYDPAVLEELAREIALLDSPGQGISPDLLRVIGEQLQRLRQGSPQPLGLREYQAMGGLENLLRGFVERRLQDLPLAEGSGRELGLAVLEEVAAACREGRSPEFSGLPERLEVDGGDLERALAWLQGPGGLVRERKDGGFEVVPQGLGAVVLKDGARRRLETKESQWILREGVRAWSQVGTLLAPETFARVDRQRRLLELTDEEAELGLQCALRYRAEEDLRGARYWLRRIGSEQDRSEALLLAVFDPSPMVRAKAATLLFGFPRPEVRDLLYLLALKDPEPQVRAAAVRSLGEMKNGELRDLLMKEVGEEGSPYHVEAVDALRIFPDEPTVGFLRKLVRNRESREPLRRKAVEVLSTLQIPAAAEALVEIALDDEDLEDRQGAARGLGSWRAEILVRECLTRLRHERPRDARHHGLARLRVSLPSPAKGGLALLVACANVFLHGLALLVIRRYLLAALVLAAEGTALWLTASTDFVGSGLLLYLVSFYAGQVLPSSLLLRERRKGKLESGTFRGALALLLFAITTLSAVWWLHGLAHALIGRWRRAVALFAGEAVGIALVVIAGLDRVKEVMPDFLEQFYLGLGWLLILGTFVYDVLRVVRESVLRSEFEERRWEVYRELLRGSVAPAVVLERLGSANREDARWAHSLLRRCGTVIEPPLLLRHLREKGGARRFVVRSLARDKREEVIHGLTGLWNGAENALRGTILAILVRRPTEASLAALRHLRSDLSLWQRARAGLSLWHFRLRVWPKAILVPGLLAAPLLVWAAVEGIDHKRHPYKAQLHVVKGRYTGASDEVRGATAEYLAKVHPSESFDTLAQVFKGTLAGEVGLGLAKSLGIIAARGDDLDLARRALEALVAGLERSSDPEVRLEIVAQIKAAGQEDSRRFLGMDVTDRLGRVLQSSGDSDLRRAVIEALEAADAVAVLQAFAEGKDMESGKGQPQAGDLLRHQEEEVLRSEAVAALGRIGSRESIQALHQLQSVPLPRARGARVREELKMSLRPLEARYREGQYEQVFNEVRQLEGLVPEPARLNLAAKTGCSLALEFGSDEASRQCVAFVEEARAAGSADPETLSLLARVYSRTGRANQAVAALDEASQIEPEESSAYDTAKAQVLLKAGRYEPAFEALRAAIDRNPRDFGSLHLLRQAYVEQGRPREAERALLDLRERHPESREIRTVLAYLYHEDLSASDPGAYEKSYLEVDALAGARQDAGPLLLANLAESEVTTKRYADAVKTAEMIVESLPGDPETELNARYFRYAALLLAGDLDAAREELQELEEGFSRLPAGFENTWVYDGTFRYFRRSELSRERKDALVRLGNLLKAGKASDEEREEVFAANRAALDP